MTHCTDSNLTSTVTACSSLPEADNVLKREDGSPPRFPLCFEIALSAVRFLPSVLTRFNDSLLALLARLKNNTLPTFTNELSQPPCCAWHCGRLVGGQTRACATSFTLSLSVT